MSSKILIVGLLSTFLWWRRKPSLPIPGILWKIGSPYRHLWHIP
jgi:hypothetical protein